MDHVRPEDVRDARLQMRNAAQWLARMTRSYAVDRDQELRLVFDEKTRHLHTPDLGGDIRLGLHLPSLVFQFSEHGSQTPHAFDADDKSSTEVEAWLLAELLHRNFDRSAFDKHLPYDWDGLMSGDAVKYDTLRLSAALHDVADDLGEAAACLTQAKLIAGRGETTAPAEALFFWPARFGIGFTLPAETEAVEVVYEGAGDETKNYCISLRSADQAKADVCVPKLSGAAADQAGQIVELIGSMLLDR